MALFIEQVNNKTVMTRKVGQKVPPEAYRITASVEADKGQMRGIRSCNAPSQKFVGDDAKFIVANWNNLWNNLS